MKEKLNRVKSWLQSKASKAGAVLGTAAVALAGAASATEGEAGAASTTSSTVISAFGTGFQGIANDMLSMIATIVPIALGVAGVVLLARKAIGWFKSMAK